MGSWAPFLWCNNFYVLLTRLHLQSGSRADLSWGKS